MKFNTGKLTEDMPFKSDVAAEAEKPAYVGTLRTWIKPEAGWLVWTKQPDFVKPDFMPSGAVPEDVNVSEANITGVKPIRFKLIEPEAFKARSACIKPNGFESPKIWLTSTKPYNAKPSEVRPTGAKPSNAELLKVRLPGVKSNNAEPPEGRTPGINPNNAEPLEV